jgi:hypothetical protein
MTRPRAADDFSVIRSRMEQLRRERTRVLAEQNNAPARRQPHPIASGPSPNRGRLRRAIRQKLLGRKPKI